MLAFCFWIIFYIVSVTYTQIPVFGKLKVLTKAALTIDVAVVSMIINCNFHKFCSLDLKELNDNLKNDFNFKGKITSS